MGSTASNSIESEHGERESDAAYINLFGANQTTGFIESAAIATERERDVHPLAFSFIYFLASV